MIQVAQKELCHSNVSMLCYKTSGKHLRVHYLVSQKSNYCMGFKLVLFVTFVTLTNFPPKGALGILCVRIAFFIVMLLYQKTDRRL